MNIFRHVFQRIWLIYTALVFIITGMIAFLIFPIIFAFSSERKGFHRGVNFTRIWSRVFSWLILMPVSVKGKEKLDPDETYIIFTNHQSQLDIPVSINATPVNYKFLSKREVKKIPVIRYPLKKLHLLVDRSSSASRKVSFENMKRAIRSDIPVMIYPEGTRNRGPGLTKNFYDGGFRLAIETQQPVAVLTIVNNWSRQNMHMRFRVAPGRVYCVWNDPIPVKGMTMGDLPALKEKVKKIMESHIRDHYGDQLPMDL